MSFTGNIGMLYTRTYFSDPYWDGKNLKFRNLDNYFTELKNASLNDFEIPPAVGNSKHGFRLTTVYPGMLAGSGIAHGIKEKEALKLGMSFDQSSGLPYIPGSSVKGVLRNAFGLDKGGYVKELLSEIIGEDKANNLSLRDLEKEIFKPEDKAIYERDIFHDAFPVQSANPGAVFLADDYITPHKDPLKDPTPISFLKILPQVTFRFDFDLKDGILSAEEKSKLFKQILLDLGIGAKTNVGYGQFTDEIPKSSTGGVKRNKTSSGFDEKISIEHRDRLTFNVFDQSKNLFEGKIIDVSEEQYLFEILDDCHLVKSKSAADKKLDDLVQKRSKKGKSAAFEEWKPGTEVQIRINRSTASGEINFTVLPIWKPQIP